MISVSSISERNHNLGSMGTMGAVYSNSPPSPPRDSPKARASLYMLLKSIEYASRRVSNYLHLFFCHCLAFTSLYRASDIYRSLHRKIKIMHFRQQLLASLALGIAVAVATTPVALQAPRVSIQILPRATFNPTPINASEEENAIIEGRARYGQPAQKPLNGCPEMFSTPTLDCSVCGGENPSLPGTCTDALVGGGWRCACRFFEQ